MSNNIESLRTFFRITTASFAYVKLINSAVYGIYAPSEMESLHNVALFEIEKENPDMQVMASLLKEMEELAEHNKTKNEL